MRWKLPKRANQPVVTKINLLVLDDVEHELIMQGNETEATEPNQPVVAKISQLELDDV